MLDESTWYLWQDEQNKTGEKKWFIRETEHCTLYINIWNIIIHRGTGYREYLLRVVALAQATTIT